MTDVMTEGGALFADLNARTVKGLLLPWNETGKSNLGAIRFAKGTVPVPRDVSIVGANVHHNRELPVGRATSLEDTDAGLVATFSIADTDEGDALLTDIADGKLTRLSAEVKNIVRRGADALSGSLFGAAFVTEGAFESAALFAELAPDPATTSSHTEDEFTDADGTVWRRVADSETTTEDNKTTTVTTVTEETEKKGDEAVLPETVPQTMTASAPAAPVRSSLRELANVLARANANNDTTLLAELAEPDGKTLFAALTDIKFDYVGSVGENIIQPAYVGQLWQGRTRPRRIIPLLASAPLTSMKEVGWKWDTKPSVSKWSGNKAAVPSNNPTTDPTDFTAARWAGAHDIAREYTDFGVDEFWTAYLKAMTDSYSEQTDLEALDILIASATTVAAGTVPTGVNKATAALVDGAIATLAKDAPSYAIVAPDVYRSLLLQGKDDIIGTLSLSLGLEDGDLSGFKIVPHENMTAGKILVGAKPAAIAKELPGSPIRVDAEDLARGGTDRGFFGYFGVDVVEPLGLSLVTVAA